MELGNSVGIPLIVISRNDDHATTINSVLRDSGHPVHCQRVNDLATLDRRACKSQPPEMLLFFDGETDVDFAAVAAAVAQCSPPPPLLMVQTSVDEPGIAAAMESGARDVVSLTHRNRLRAVVGRELHAHRLRLALEGVLSSARQYKQELRSLMSGASEAIADVHDGIIVAVNPAWAALLGMEAEEELIGQPFMDLFREADQATLKGALVACLKDKWQDDGVLPVVAYRRDESELPLELRLKRVTVDGDPGVRVIVPSDRQPEQAPEDLLEQAVAKDPSTGFYQRHYFLDRLTGATGQSAGGRRPCTCLHPTGSLRPRPGRRGPAGHRSAADAPRRDAARTDATRRPLWPFRRHDVHRAGRARHHDGRAGLGQPAAQGRGQPGIRSRNAVHFHVLHDRPVRDPARRSRIRPSCWPRPSRPAARAAIRAATGWC